MDMKIKSLLIILIVLIASCKSQNKENNSSNSTQDEILVEEIQETKIDKIKITEQLQGKWKEIEYPYRTAEFVRSTVKFVEEGTVNPPKFEKFEISEDCQFDNNNIRDLKSGDVILTLPETTKCEKLMVSNDTLTLSGFSTNSNDDYHIVYLKLE
tara:strand:- start:141 stop:605 length:465 start_codon:yes stop_codon:yes gene_type:complete